MKLHALALTAVLAFGGLALGGLAFAEDAAKAPSTQPTDASADAIAVNKMCPITGDAIDPKGPKVMYDGKVIGFCCSDCPPKFKENPAKYMKDLK
jgi:YHS domain-containing protein